MFAKGYPILLSKLVFIALYHNSSCSAVTVTLSPSGDVPVCPGDELVVTCRATNLNVVTDTIIWTITTNIEGRQSDGDERLISALGQRTITPITLNMNTFIFTNKTHFNSDTNLVTLTSNVSVTVTDYLNGTVITCSTLDANSSIVFDMTTIHIIGNESNSNVALNEFEVESNISKTTSTNFTVTLSWEREIGTHFTVHVVPDADLNFTSTTKVQVTMSYSVSYTVTIVGTRCGQNVSMVVKEFNYKSSEMTNEAISNGITRLSVLFIAINTIALFCLCILIALFISLVVNCYVCVKYKRSRGGSSDAGKSSDHLQLSNPTHPVYDTAANSVKDSKTQELDMTENVAYGPLRSTQL